MKEILFLIAVILQLSTSAQIQIIGIVVDSKTNTSLPYVNIGIKNKNIGTTSQSDGTFSIIIPQQNENDSLTFSMIGYYDLTLGVKEIISSNKKSFPLELKITELKMVDISSIKLVEKEFGIIKGSSLFTLTDGSTNQNDIFEIGQNIKLDTNLSKITSVNLLITEERKDSGTFRINFYRFDGENPSEKIVEKNIIQTMPIHEGWLKFDLTKYNIYLKGEFIISVEFIPSGKGSGQIYYEVKLGGSARSFMRSSSQGEWTSPPHHYCMFVTALVQDKKNSKNVVEDVKESVPAAQLYSKSVNDSFYIYIHAPHDYQKRKNKYPVIYVLDANVYFDIVANLLNEKNSQSILVGIGYKDFIQMDSLRDRDYTFPGALAEDSFHVSGGASKFLSFIEEELIPYIDSNYRTNSIRSLMGHSLGGFFTLYTLQKELNENTNYFSSYTAASPSLDYCNKYIMNQFQNISDESNSNHTLFLSAGTNEDTEEGDTPNETMDNISSFIKILSEKKIKGLTVTDKIYPNFGHMQTAIPSFKEGIKYGE